MEEKKKSINNISDEKTVEKSIELNDEEIEEVSGGWTHPYEYMKRLGKDTQRL